MTFPWPHPAPTVKREQVAAVSVELLARRSVICRDRGIGLTRLYNDIGEGAHQDMRTLHRRLDEAVAGCYGWPKAVAQDDAELVRRLVELNSLIAGGGRPYVPFDANGRHPH